ncbi:MAG TPA: AsmA family protein, partial [Hyphomicrobiales bacterium]|nr:AsmA family protein [Hyphomicrobiales bacterium]
FQEATGRTLTLNGPLSLSLYPWLGVTLEDVSIGNAPGFSDAPLLQLDSAALRIKLMPLLRNSYEIDTIRVDGLDASLEVLADGRNNWTFGDADEAASSQSGSSSGGGINNLVLGGVDIRNTRLVYDDKAQNAHYEIKDLALQIDELVYGEPLNITMMLDASSRNPQFDAEANMSGTVLYDLDNERYDLDPLALTATLRGPALPSGSADVRLDAVLGADLDADTLRLSRFELDAFGNRLNATAEVARMSTDKPAVQAEIDANGNDLATLFRLIGQNDLAQRSADLERRYAVKTALNADLGNGTLTLPSLSVDLFGTTVTGRVEASRLNTDTPAFNGELSANGPDLPLIMQIIGQLQGGREAMLNQYGRQLRTVSDRAFTLQTRFDADLQSGNIDLPVLDAKLLGFTLGGQLTARDMQSRRGSVDGQFDLSGNNLREVLTALGQADLAEVANSVQAKATVSGTGNTFRISPFNATLALAGRGGNQPQTLSLQADTNVNLDNDSLGVDTFTLNGLGLDLSGKIRVQDFSGAMAYDGEIAVAEFNARDLLRQLNQPPPDTRDASVLQKVALQSVFSGTANSINVNELALRLDDTTLTGSLNLSDFAAPAGRFALNVDTIDADRYLAPDTSETAAASSSEDDLPTDTLRTANVQGEIRVGQLGISGLSMSDILVQLNAAKGDVALSPIRANLYQGSFNGDIHLDVTGAQPTASVATTLSAIDLEPLLQDFMGSAYLSGKGSVQLTLAGNGADLTTIKHSLNGKGAVNLEDGVLNGIDVGDVLARVETMIRNRRLVQLPQSGGQTPFDTFAATLAIQNGVVSTNDLDIAAPDWAITGNGTLANLNDDTINFNLVTLMQEGTLTADGTEYEVGGHALPIACSGNLSSPRCLPDVQAIFTAAVGNVVQQRLGEFLQDRFGGPAQQNAAPATGTPAQEGETAPQPQEEPATEQQQQNPTEQLLNRALDRLRR